MIRSDVDQVLVQRKSKGAYTGTFHESGFWRGLGQNLVRAIVSDQKWAIWVILAKSPKMGLKGNFESLDDHFFDLGDQV